MDIRKYKIPRHQWANPHMFFFVPETEQTVGDVLPPIARYRPYIDQAEVFFECPLESRKEGSLVAIFEAGSDTDYALWYWTIDRTNGEPANFWALKKVSQNFIIDQSITVACLNSGGSSFIPPHSTVHKVACSPGNNVVIGIVTGGGDSMDWDCVPGRQNFIDVGIENNTADPMQIDFIPVGPNLNPYVIVMYIGKNPFQ